MRVVVRWALFCIGFCVGTAGLFMIIGGLVGDALSPAQARSDGLLVAAAGAVLFCAGWYLGARTLPAVTAFAGLPSAFLAALGGIALAVTAIVLPRAKPANLDPDRATADAWTGVVLCLLAAGGLVLYWALWRRRPGAHKATRSALHGIAVAWGVLEFLSGLGMAAAAVFNMIQVRGVHGSSHGHLNAAVLLAGLAAVSLGTGVILVWHGTAATTGTNSTRFRPPPAWLPLVVLLLGVSAAEALIQTDTAVGFMPPAQAVAVTMPGLAILALISRAGEGLRAAGRSSWSELLLMIAYGASVATAIAGTINSLVITASVTLALTAHGSLDGVQSYRQFSDRAAHASNYLGTVEQLVPLLVSIAIIGPLNEEFWKGLGVRLLRDHRPTRYRAFLWGLASGIGFGATEVTQYGFAAFARSPYRWWDVVLIRGAASSMHALASGIVGIGWFYAFSGRWRRFSGCYLLAVALHGSWNGLSVLTAARVLPPFRGLSQHDLEIVLELVVAVIAVVILTVLFRLARRLAAEDEGPNQPPRRSPDGVNLMPDPAAP